MSGRQPHTRPVTPVKPDESLASLLLGAAAIVAWFLILFVLLPLVAG